MLNILVVEDTAVNSPPSIWYGYSALVGWLRADGDINVDVAVQMTQLPDSWAAPARIQRLLASLKYRRLETEQIEDITEVEKRSIHAGGRNTEAFLES